MTLQALVLEDAGVSDEGALSLSIGLQSNPVLHSIQLPRNSLTTTGLENLVDCLDVNFNLTHLSLPYNNVTDIPASLLAYLKTETCTLRRLCLNFNPLKATAVANLLNSLLQNKSLLSLSLILEVSMPMQIW